MRTWALALLIVLALALPGLSAGATDEVKTYSYRITHEVYGEIGRHWMTVRRHGEDMVVEQTSNITVRIASIPIYRRDSNSEARFKGGKMLAFAGRTDDDGEIIEVSAQVSGDRLMVNGVGSVEVAPPDAVPSVPSVVEAAARRTFIDVTTGAVLEGEVEWVGQEPVEIDGTWVQARKVIANGDLDYEVWYDEDGAWLQWRLHREGTVTLTRENL